MDNEPETEFERVSTLLERLRELRPESVPNSSLHALHVHDDTLAAIRDLRLSQAERESLPEKVLTELKALEARFGEDTAG